MSRSTKKATAEMNLWNQLCPPGTLVAYIPFSARSIPAKAKTTGAAWILSGVGAVVGVEGDTMAVPLARCRVIVESPEAVTRSLLCRSKYAAECPTSTTPPVGKVHASRVTPHSEPTKPTLPPPR